MTWQPIFPKISITSVVYLLSKTYFNNGFSCQHNIVFVVERILSYLNTIFRSCTIISAICVDYSWKKDLWIMMRSSVILVACVYDYNVYFKLAFYMHFFVVYTGTSEFFFFEYHEKGYYLSLISESETHILYRCITHRVKYFKPLFLDILTIKTYRELKPKIQCLRKLEYYIRSIKKDILNRNVRLLKSMFISMHSIHGWGSFCVSYCINAAWHEDDQSVALLRCNEAQVALIAVFSSSGLLGLVSLIIDYLCGSGQVSLLANQTQ